MSIRSIGLVLASLSVSIATSAAPAAAQDVPTRVAPPGALRIEAGGVFSLFGDTFGSPGSEAGARIPFSTPFQASLDGVAFLPLDILERRLGRLVPAGENEGDLEEAVPLAMQATSLRLSGDRREVPFKLEIGIVPRLSLQVRVPLVQNWVQITGLTIDGGNVGINPDGGFNTALVAGTDTTLIALASGRLLPVAGTHAAERLQDSVRAATGGNELRLPASATGQIGVLGLADVTGFERVMHQPGVPAWGLGDVSISGRLALVNTIGMTLAPEDGSGFRVTAEGGLRFPTGTPVSAEYLGLPPPDDGLSGFYVAAAADAFFSPRLGLSAHGRFERLDGTDVGRRVWLEGEEFPPIPANQTLRWEPGQRFTISALPRFQIVDEISLFGRISLTRRTGESFAPVVDTPTTRTARLWGIGAQFSTLRPGDPQVRRLPFEVVVELSGHTGGSGGQPAMRNVAAALRFYPRFWGGGGRPSDGGGAVQQEGTSLE